MGVLSAATSSFRQVLPRSNKKIVFNNMAEVYLLEAEIYLPEARLAQMMQTSFFLPDRLWHNDGGLPLPHSPVWQLQSDVACLNTKRVVPMFVSCHHVASPATRWRHRLSDYTAYYHGRSLTAYTSIKMRYTVMNVPLQLPFLLKNPWIQPYPSELASLELSLSVGCSLPIAIPENSTEI